MNEIEIRIKADGIDYAEGSFPHPKGIVEMKWHMENDKRIFDFIRAPEGVNVKIIE